MVLVPGCTDWLAEISADLREAVAHLRRVPNDALYKSTVTLLTLLTRCVLVALLSASGGSFGATETHHSDTERQDAGAVSAR